MGREKIAILFSGGLESTALIEYYRQKDYEITLLYISFGYIWEEAEYYHAQKIASYFDLEINFIDYSKILHVDQLGEVDSLEKNIIPLRNLSLFTFAALYITKDGISKLAIGLQGDTKYPDTSLKYIKEAQTLISQGLQNSSFTIYTPFYGLSKDEVAKKFTLPLNLVFSCTNPIGLKRCHKCFKCKKLDLVINNHIK